MKKFSLAFAMVTVMLVNAQPLIYRLRLVLYGAKNIVRRRYSNCYITG